jgi:sugar/nucleoside kinase (ribokinase family)
LGAGRVAVLGAIGDDGFGHELKRALAARGVDSGLLVCSPQLPTFTYTKLLNAHSGEEDLPRLDFIYTQPVPVSVEDVVIRNLRESARDFDLVLVSDQAETSQGGVVTPRVREVVAELAASDPEKVIWVDSRMRSHLFHGVILKPNESEAEAASVAALGRRDYPALRRRLEAPLLFVTQGARGVLVVDESGEKLVSGRAISNPIDICGAGDSFSAGAAVALAATRSPVEAAQFGNLIASITIMKKGTGTASPQEVREAARSAGVPA